MPPRDCMAISTARPIASWVAYLISRARESTVSSAVSSIDCRAIDSIAVAQVSSSAAAVIRERGLAFRWWSRRSTSPLAIPR